jgi:dipeptidyl aminopeptidase/acylaminoacyl peptidase
MRRRSELLPAARAMASAILISIFAVAQVHAAGDGTIVERQPCRLSMAYEELEPVWQQSYSRAAFEDARTQQMYECSRVTYLSGGLKVVGFVYGPKDHGSGQLPAIIYNRGGTATFHVINQPYFPEFHALAKEGFVVLASNYRGSGGEGVDEWGGADVDDVLNLVPLARRLGYVDLKNLFMMGSGRGGLTTYVALKRQMPVNAAAVISGISDLKAFAAGAPRFLEGWPSSGWLGFRSVWPDFERRQDEHFSERSAVRWPERINVPVLILHSRTTPFPRPEQALDMAAKLQEHRKPYELVIYADDLNQPPHREDKLVRVLAWFRKHRK